MTAPTITPAAPRFLPDAVADARIQLAAARSTNIDDHTALAASHANLAATVARLLWNVDPEAAS